MQKKQTLVDRFNNETVLYGGLPLRRGDVYRDVISNFGNTRMADFFAYSGAAVSMSPLDYAVFQRLTDLK